ncbi:EAL domain-containing protein [Novosphingobium nitrogenifigens]|nr:EAL domain-containing protein [Novosphingobium nitrogenifigens]
MYWNVVYKLWQNPAPSDIVIVDVDDIADQGVGAQARLLNLVSQAKIARLFVDFRTNPASRTDVNVLRAAFAKLPRNASFVVRGKKPDRFDRDAFEFPEKWEVGNHPIVISTWIVDFVYFVQRGTYSVEVDGVEYPSLSSELSGRRAGFQSQYFPDFSVDPLQVSKISASSILSGRTPLSSLDGKKVILSASGLSASEQGVSYGYFGHRLASPVYFDIAGVSALRRPFSFNLSGIFVLSIAFISLIIGHASRNAWIKLCAYVGVLGVVFLLPVILRWEGLVSYPDTAMICVFVFAAVRLWQKRTRRIQHTSVSGLPNMLALSASTLPVGRDVIVAVVARYEEMLATLPHDLHGECAKQIARRISVGSGSETIYHSDGGHFAWTEEARPLDMQLSHLEGLRALFATPLQIGPHTFDTNIHFGVDRNEGVDAPTRVNSALASANEALANGRAIELFEAHRLVEAPWELSLHARIDEGLRNGDIWLAFQPQYDIGSGRICGAEALIRWNHPTRGPIAPNAFILQAERAGRIDALTYWVLENAITAALAINAKGERLQMSVNLSAQMVDKPDLVRNFSDIVSRRKIDPGLITIEVTETASLGNRAAAFHNLSQLRKMGFLLSIDDFGTGEASLAYLADLPSDEIKIDRRFVARIIESDRDRAIVASTIQLAHALGQTVVAEGIEDASTLALLRDLGCDHAQGYYLGKPEAFAGFERHYDASRMARLRGV